MHMTAGFALHAALTEHFFVMMMCFLMHVTVPAALSVIAGRGGCVRYGSAVSVRMLLWRAGLNAVSQMRIRLLCAAFPGSRSLRMVRIGSGGFFRTVAENRKMCAGDAAFLRFLRPNGDSGNAERLKRAEESIAVRQKLKQCSRQHVACRAHAAIQIQCFHIKFRAPALPAAEEGVLS